MKTNSKCYFKVEKEGNTSVTVIKASNQDNAIKFYNEYMMNSELLDNKLRTASSVNEINIEEAINIIRKIRKESEIEINDWEILSLLLNERTKILCINNLKSEKEINIKQIMKGNIEEGIFIGMPEIPNKISLLSTEIT